MSLCRKDGSKDRMQWGLGCVMSLTRVDYATFNLYMRVRLAKTKKEKQ
jgi:hypothetical protein